MNDCEFPEQRFATPGYDKVNHPSVRRGCLPREKSAVTQTICELDNGVMLQVKAGG
jgi:hypothetical protein